VIVGAWLSLEAWVARPEVRSQLGFNGCAGARPRCGGRSVQRVLQVRAIRTTNLRERLFAEERRRLKIIPNAFGERSVLKLMFGAVYRH
jgi:hypothetical protein